MQVVELSVAVMGRTLDSLQTFALRQSAETRLIDENENGNKKNGYNCQYYSKPHTYLRFLHYNVSCFNCSTNESMRCNSFGIFIVCGQWGEHWSQPMQ